MTSSWTVLGIRQFRLLAVIDESTRQCLAIEVGRSCTARRVIDVLQHLFAVRGTSDHIRNDNGLEFLDRPVCRWLDQARVDTLFIAKVSPWENGFVESYNGKLCKDSHRTSPFIGTSGRLSRPNVTVEIAQGVGFVKQQSFLQR